jgi:predicted alpha/beta hydrolase family esterase
MGLLRMRCATASECKGHGPGTGALIRGLRKDLPDTHFEVFHWGAPAPLFMLNLQNDPIHRDAERKLAQVIEDRAALESHPQIDLVAHSAGCGVVLGAMTLLNDVRVQSMVLLSPSVSPGYELHPAMARVMGNIHVFYSEHDTLWLGWRSSNFGTYDNVKTKASGKTGFANPPQGVIQYAYQPGWNSLGNDGGHFGTLSFRFAQQVVSPLLIDEASSLATQSDDALRQR